MLAPTHQPGIITGSTHTIECPNCLGEGGALGHHCCGGQGCGADGKACWTECTVCDGNGVCEEEVSPEDCECDRCVAGFWFFPADGELAERFDTFTDALRNTRFRPGEITQRKLSGTPNALGRRALRHEAICNNVTTK